MCPDLEELEHFEQGRLDDGTGRRISEHLSACRSCEDSLSDIRQNLKAAPMVAGYLAMPPDDEIQAKLPERIASYRILREIGRGGMGVVYEAQQERPSRRVALKLIRSTALSKQVLRRFEQEAQLLGRLHHANIAQVFEAGTADTPEGRLPFLVMELVSGLPLHRYLLKFTPTIRERLELFVQICEGVQHAHDHGVIHRDLKPGNVLVVRSEPVEESLRRQAQAPGGQPQARDTRRLLSGLGLAARAPGSDQTATVKILDFGVARATDAEALATTLATGEGQLVGTIPYMSPEQVAGAPGSVDARTDVYSLGVLLFELLAGRLPYPLADRPIADAARIIRDEEPTRLSFVNREFRGDLDTIVARALEKDPHRRYAAAAALADDVRRYLSDQPILARPASAVYQLRKFARRNRAIVGGALAVLIVLVIGTAVSTSLAIRALRAESEARQRLDDARQAQAHAEREAAKAVAVTDFLQEMLESVSPDKSPGARDVTVREVLGQARQKLDEGSLQDQPEIEVAIRTTLGNTYRALGQPAEAEPEMRAAVRLAREIGASEAEALSLALNKLARVVADRGDYEESEALFREALDIRRALYGDEHLEVAVLLNNLGLLLNDRGHTAEAESMLRESLQMRRRLIDDDDSRIASSLNNLAIVLSARGAFDEAANLFRESLDIDRRLRGAHPNVAKTMVNLALTLSELQNTDEARALLEEACEIQHRLLGEQHPDYSITLNNLAMVLRRQGKSDEAAAAYRRALDILRNVLGDDHPRTALTMGNLASVLLDRNELDEADALQSEALDVYLRKLGDRHPGTLIAFFRLADVRLRQGRFTEAEELARRAAEAAPELIGETHPHTGYILLRHGKCLLALDRPEEARSRLSRAHEILLATRGPNSDAARDAADTLTQAMATAPRPSSE